MTANLKLPTAAGISNTNDQAGEWSHEPRVHRFQSKQRTICSSNGGDRSSLSRPLRKLHLHNRIGAKTRAKSMLDAYINQQFNTIKHENKSPPNDNSIRRAKTNDQKLIWSSFLLTPNPRKIDSNSVDLTHINDVLPSHRARQHSRIIGLQRTTSW